MKPFKASHFVLLVLLDTKNYIQHHQLKNNPICLFSSSRRTILLHLD